ncbi:MAG: alkaline phosphatase PhoX [Planctomycetaceae bacterium]
MLSRRKFLKNTAAVTAGFYGLRSLIDGSVKANDRALKVAGGYGDLLPDPSRVIDLPDGFSYQIISVSGRKMDDGFILPGLPDGMATFAGPDGLTILIRNHELSPNGGGPFEGSKSLAQKIDPSKVYDTVHGKMTCGGGTTTVVFDTKKQRVVREYLSLTGTVRNCAGGPTPWNSWISCEETILRAGVDTQSNADLDHDHGYNFEVPASAEISLADPVPLKAMGRFVHEAVAVDPKTSIVYQTEDEGDGALYRFIPNEPEKLAAGGKLQVLKVRDKPSLDTRNWIDGSHNIAVGQLLDVEWLDLDDVEAPNGDLRHRSFDAGGARFARGEGIWYSPEGIFIACTSGGIEKKGQIWKYIPSPHEGTADEQKAPGRLELFIEPNDSALVENADNLTVSPWGDLMVCEDRTGDEVRLVGVTPQGKLYTFAHSHMRTEFAGAVFSPDGSTLFVNMQGKGFTLAITGPWMG